MIYLPRLSLRYDKLSLRILGYPNDLRCWDEFLKHFRTRRLEALLPARLGAALRGAGGSAWAGVSRAGTCTVPATKKWSAQVARPPASLTRRELRHAVHTQEQHRLVAMNRRHTQRPPH